MDERERKIAAMNKELERLRRRIAELESGAAGDGRPDEELRETILRQNAILNNIPDIAWLKDRESRFIAGNGPFGEACGVAPADLAGKTDLDIWPRDLAEGYRADDAEVMRTGKRKRVEERLVGPDGRERWIETIKTPIVDAQGTVIGTTGIARDITERKQAEAKLRNVSRLYAFLSQINQAIVRTRDRDELFRTICRVAIEFGRFRMAWVGLVDAATGIVRPAAHDGRDEGYLSILSIGIHDEATSKGPTGSALREGMLTICDDIATDPRMVPWREEALKRGYRSSAAIPLRLKEKVIGSLNLYAAEPGFFTEDERKLLTEIGVDISFALDTMEGEKDRKRTEEALFVSKERYRSFFENAAVAVALVDQAGHVVEANDADCRFLGYTHSELMGMHFTQFTHPQDMDLDLALYQALLSGQRKGYEIEKRYIRKDGETVWGRLAVSLIRGSDGRPEYTLVVCVDITERKRAEEALRESEHRYRTLFETMAQGVVYQAADGRIISSNPAAVRILGLSVDQMQGRTSMDPRWRAVRENGSVFPGDQHPAMEALRTGKPVHDTIMGVFHPGRNEYRWILVNAVPEYLPGETKPYQVYATFTDVTDRKKNEEDLRQRTQGLSMLLEVSKDLAETLDLGTVLQATTDGVTRLSGLDTSAVYILEGDLLRLGATTPPLLPQFPEELRNALLTDHPHIHQAITSRMPVFVPDMATADLTPAERAVSEQRGLRTLLFLPLIAGVKPVGTLIVGSITEPRTISDTEIDLCKTLANLAALAVENAGLYRSGQKYAADLEQTLSDRKRAEEALRESEARMRSLIERAPFGAHSYELQPDGRLIFAEANQAADHILALDHSTLIGKTIEEAFPGIVGTDIPDIYRRVAATGATHEAENVVYEHDRIHGAFAIHAFHTWPNRMTVFFQDITERKKADEALRQSEERLRLALSAAKQGLYDLNVQTGETVVTPEYALMLGYAPGAFIETNAQWIERLHPDDRAPVAETYRAYVNGALPEYRVEFRQKTKSGEWKWILSIGKIVEYDASGDPLRMLGTHTDITDRKRAEQERLELERRLLHAQKLESLGILAGGIAHDFNNLLMAVLGNLDLALRKLSPVSSARLNIEQSAQAARRAADLTRQMLAYSGKGSFVVKPMDLSELVEENAHLFRSSVARTTELNVRLDRSLPAIDADAGQVQQVIMNLITNASEAIGEEAGMITLATGVQECDSECLKRSRVDAVPDAGRFVFLEVSDNGCGMDEQTQQRLFDPFFTTKAMGRGLGMSAILGIVRGHGGAIFVDSSPGKGTTIRILFPASQGALALYDGPVVAAAQQAADPVLSGTVLVVDDEAIVRNVCKEMVEALGLHVLTAVDGRDAVEVFTKHPDDISLVILDLSMPNMDGMTAFKELVRIRPGVKVILCSGFDEQDSLQRLSGQGPAGFIQKPYSMKNLRDALEKAGIAGG